MFQIRWLWRNIERKYRVALIVALILSAGTSVMLVINPFLSAKLIDDVIIPQNPDPLLPLLFWAILCVFPNRRIPLLRALPGAAGASLGWLVFSSLFSVYVQHFGSYSVFYGSLAGIAMAMLWLYVCMSILFYGGVLNCLLFERRLQQGK